MILGTTLMRNQRNRPRLLQAMAFFFVVFYLLSSVRGLVPGLCLNLRAPDAISSQQADSTCAQAAAVTCCAKVKSNDSGNSERTPQAPKRCPFCRLALGLSETPVYVHFEPLATMAYRPAFPSQTVELPTRFDIAVSERGPPALLPA